jgi:hypothetical protein
MNKEQVMREIDDYLTRAEYSLTSKSIGDKTPFIQWLAIYKQDAYANYSPVVARILNEEYKDLIHFIATRQNYKELKIFEDLATYYIWFLGNKKYGGGK